MTEKENLMLMFRGEAPEWVPRYGVQPDPKSGYKPPIVTLMPSVTAADRSDGGRDIFGVTYSATDSAGGGSLPTPNHFILDDIRKWRDVIKVPDLSGVDWEATVKKDLEKCGVDRRESALSLATNGGYFQHLMNFMGFTEGLCALIEEPEEVHALYSYLADFYEGVTKKYLYYAKPDILSLGDDNATSRNPFISLDLYRSLLKPYQSRLGYLAMDAGIPADMHDCGRCEDFIDDWLEFGVRMWNPAQVMNDLVGIKKKYGNKLILCGCWDSSGPVGWPDAKEEFVRSEVRKCIDTFAPGGGFCFWGFVFGPPDDPRVKERAWWLTDEHNKYGRTWYKTHA